MKAPASRRGSSVTPSRGACSPRGRRLIWLLMSKATTEAFVGETGPWRDVWVDRSRPHTCLVQRLSTLLWASRWMRQPRAGPMACGVFSMIRPGPVWLGHSWIFESWMSTRLLVGISEPQHVAVMVKVAPVQKMSLSSVSDWSWSLYYRKKLS